MKGDRTGEIRADQRHINIRGGDLQGNHDPVFPLFGERDGRQIGIHSPEVFSGIGEADV
jgi:hypothetical protein